MHHLPFGAFEELDIGAEHEIGRDADHIVEAFEVQARRVIGAHGEGIGVLETERSDQLHAVLRLGPARDLGDHRRARFGVLALHLVGPDCTGIIDIDLHLVAGDAR